MSYSIGEVAEMLNTQPSTLRYYESEGLLPNLERTANGRRRFSDTDIEACRVIECLKESGLSIKEIRDFMEMVQAGDSTLTDRLALFEARRESVLSEIERLQETLAVLDFKCWYYETALKAGAEDVVKNLPVDKIPKQHRKAKHLISRKTSE